jgi:hypothetical protein
MMEITGFSNGSIQRLTGAMWNERSRQNCKENAVKVGQSRKGEKKPWLSDQLRRAWKEGKYDFHCAGRVYLDFDKSRFILGSLCHNKHDYKGTGQSLRRLKRRLGKLGPGDCLLCQKEDRRRRYAADPEKATQEMLAWYAENKERATERFKQYYVVHKSEICAYQRRYREQNSDQVKAKKLEYYRTPRGHELTRRRNARYRTALNNASGVVTQEYKETVLTAFDWACPACHVLMQEFGRAKDSLTWDHMIPLTRGGIDDNTNLLPMCRSCNSRKGTAALHEWMPAPEYQRIEAILKGVVC